MPRSANQRVRPLGHGALIYVLQNSGIILLVRILHQLSQAPANVNFPRIARALSFKPIWNVTAAFIGWKVSAKKACVKIHIVWHAIKNIVSNKYTLFDLLCFSHSNCGSPPAKSYANKRTFWKKNSGIYTAGSNQLSLDHRSNALHTELYRRYNVLELSKYRQWINITRGCAMRKRDWVILV